MRTPLLINAQHIVFHAACSSVSVVSHCRLAVAYSRSFEIALHAQSCHTFETDPVQKPGDYLMPNLLSVSVRMVSDSSTMRKDCASRYGHVGTVVIPLACPLQGFLFVVRGKCNQLLGRIHLIFKCKWWVFFFGFLVESEHVCISGHLTLQGDQSLC